ncbi:MAG: hypothetical protein A2831_00860 [Candidatus Yanofskybacteria bacterium RIFCSPHIGHO2_01_FULL_44_17]|uniref:Uncharacterized protein n=1 Tax=Candidatus Yanofskybacteria bacterium RIFCSPHIGHO2_01_FULL_44_17 TaxID=1802668 RepID=A0A1F8EUK4_9BACT|nr:MAG: hypothetical protein A2831_00860 [Candidatus Yanofskybacteria bacterium RIFCSPHIGHO2_01_FULL_44_17]
MIGLGFFIFFLLTIRMLSKLIDEVRGINAAWWPIEIMLSAIPAVFIEFGFRYLLKASPFN